METRTRSASLTWAIAVLALFSLLATACGTSVVASASADRTAADSVPAALAEPTASANASSDDGPQYGATIEEYGETVSQGGHSEPLRAPDADPSNSDFPTISWDDLIPPGASGAEIMDRYEDRLDAVEVGSAQAAALYEEMRAEFNSDAVNDELDGQPIRLAGFVAPLTFDADELVTEFLLVPNFGACIHVPPPPPNQTIFVTVESGLTYEDTWGAVWVEGTLVIDSQTTDLATASYTITGGSSGVYDDF